MHTSIKTSFLSGLVLVSGAAAHAAVVHGATGAPVDVAVVCTCDDSAGQQYGKAVREVLSRDSHFRQVSEAEAERADAIQIHIISQPMPGPDGREQEAISVVYTHDGAFLHQFINTTCADMPIGDSATKVVREIRSMEKDVQELASAPEPPRVHKL